MNPAKRYVPLALILAAGIVAIVMVQRKQIDTEPSAEAILTAAADAQHELTRVPAKLDPMLDPLLGTFTDADEVALGNVLAERAAASLGIATNATPHDAAMQAYLQILGTHIATNARRKLPWNVHYIPDPQFVNAFALPGGHVFIGEGLIMQMKSQDALAAVLGHEIEHIDLRHCAERAQAEARLRHLGAVGDLVDLPMQLFVAGYTKEQELEADRDGTTLAVQAGYSYTASSNSSRTSPSSTSAKITQRQTPQARLPKQPSSPSPRSPVTLPAIHQANSERSASETWQPSAGGSRGISDHSPHQWKPPLEPMSQHAQPRLPNAPARSALRYGSHFQTHLL